MKKTTGTYSESSAKIGFHNWNLLEEMKELQQFIPDLLTKIVKEGMELATSEYTCKAWFPIQYAHVGDDGARGKPVNDPKIIYVELPIGPSEDEAPGWSFSLDDLVDDLLWAVSEDDPIDNEARPGLASIRDALREAADKIDQVLQRPEPG